MKAVLRFQRKLTLVHSQSGEIAIAELKVWDVPRSAHYPEGLKYSLFLVARESGCVVVGFDNHKPKGPHLHQREVELPYQFLDVESLVEDFWRRVEREGFIL